MPAALDFSQVLAHLRDMSRPLPGIDLYALSDLSGKELEALEAAWPDIPVERRRSVVQDMSGIAEVNFEVAFEPVFRLGLEDADGEVRAVCIGGLWEAEEPDLIAPFLEFLLRDPDPRVRAVAASALGRFVYLGEVEELPAPRARRIEEALLAVIGGDDVPDVRRRALEAIAYSAREEVAPLIAAAYASPDESFRVSAVFAMGRSADQRWASQVLAELDSGVPEIRFEAARAAGELELKDAVPALAQLSEDGDQAVREAAIWSLSQVGGPDARRVLTRLLRQAGEDEQDFIEEALENLAFTDDVQSFSLLAFGDDDGSDDNADLS